MVKLKNLWLDWCDLTGLPLEFSNLTSLRTLKMEGNSNLVLPSIDIILGGVDKVMEWCVDRQTRVAYRRRQSTSFSDTNLLVSVLLLWSFFFRGLVGIVEEVLQFLHIIKKNTLFEESYFEADVVIGNSEDTKCFALVMDLFYAEMIPKIVGGKHWDGSETVFGTVEDYIDNRAEVDQALQDHQDSMGKLSYWGYTTYFKRCQCIDAETGMRRVCVPPKTGWQCERVATLIRSHLFSQEVSSNMCSVHNRRECPVHEIFVLQEVKQTLAKKREDKAVDLAVSNAEVSALVRGSSVLFAHLFPDVYVFLVALQDYLNSVDGRDYTRHLATERANNSLNTAKKKKWGAKHEKKVVCLQNRTSSRLF
jgi:hypothetical protein